VPTRAGRASTVPAVPKRRLPGVSATLSDPLVGHVVDGRYAVASRIARGGMATVYLATDNRLDREVALKVMHPHLAEDEQFVARFHREAKSAARMSHPSIVAVYDQGAADGAVYLAMEHVPGSTLRDLLEARGTLTAREALDVLEPVLDALSAAHRAGIVHRDVKPENVLLTEDGRVKVADFGLARAASTSQTGTTTGMLIGTVAYLSPELVLRGIADARTDVYAVGIMAFEMLTGRRPFTGDVPIQVAYQHVNCEVPPPSTLNPGIPDALDDLVRWTTARDPDERPADARELVSRLREVRHQLAAEELDRRPERTGPTEDTAEDLFAPPPGATLGLRREGPAVAPPGTAQGEPETHPVARRRRRGGLLTLVAALVVALVLGGGWFFLAGPGSYTTMPGVVGQPVASAQQSLAAAGLKWEELPRYSETVPKGDVIDTRPANGADVRRGGTVHLFVSQGSQFVAVPELVGVAFEDAKTALATRQLEHGTVSEQFSETVPAGAVLSQSVPGDQQLKRGEAVDLVVSKGREPMPVPSVAGKAKDEAVAAIEATELKVALTEEFSETVPAGVVISQAPADGTLFRGDTVSVVVSKGPPLVAVPKVVGEQVGDATTALEAAGFSVKVERVLGGFFGTVRSQAPEGGSQAPRGSTITLTIV
jgi:eukaryotic-like serine/threonine-protein kinase